MRLIKPLLFFLLLLITVGGLGFLYVQAAYPKVAEPADIRVEIRPDRIARGEYLANHVSVCMDCHSQRDYTLFSGPLVEGSFGGGGEKFDQNMGFPGEIYSRNLTPHNLSAWTDGEILRAMTCGVSNDDSPLFTVMPWKRYRTMSREDLYSIIAYLRTLEPVESEWPESELDFPVNFFMKMEPEDCDLKMKTPTPEDGLAYGKYLINAAACGDCHTRMENGQFTGEPYAGGFEFQFPTGTLVSPNITPDPETGIGLWSADQFINRFKMYSSEHYSPNKIEDFSEQTVMPWTMYAGMTETDLKAIYEYLMSLEPVKNPTERFVAAR